MNMPQQRRTQAIWVGTLILVPALAASWASIHWLGLFPTRFEDLTVPSLLHAILVALVVIALAVGIVIVRRGREVRLMEARLQSVLDSTLDAVAVMDRQSRILLANAQFEKIFGYDRREVAGQPIQRLIAKHPQTIPDPPSASVSEFGLLGRHKTGREIPLDVRLYPQQTPEGVVVTSAIRDASGRQQSAAALQLRDEALKAISQGIFITNHTQPDDPIVYVNPAFERFIGRPAAEVLGQTWRSVLGSGSSPEALEGIRAAFQDGSTSTTEFSGTRPDGSPFCAVLSVSPIRDATGQVSHFAGVVTDITEQRRLEAQLRQALKMEAIGRLAGGMAHDFNNLLTVILGHSEMIMKDLEPEHAAQLSAREIHEAGERAAQLTRQLLAFSRKQVLAPVTINLNGLVTDMEKMMRRLIREDIELSLTLEPNLRPVKVDPGQMTQVLMNLLVNARDAMPQGGRIAIRTANIELTEAHARRRPEIRPGPYIQLEISDTGCGIDDAIKSHIFEPFFTTKELGRGTGLGLATVYGIIKQSDGYIYLDSTVGRGTTFTIYLPQAQHETATNSKVLPSPMPVRNREQTVLLVEDDENLRALISKILTEGGYKVLTARNGPEALNLSHQHRSPIHLVLTDVVMPIMSGTALARRLMKQRPDLRVLYMSGYTESAVACQGISTSDLIFLQKPFKADDLVAKVRETLETPLAAPGPSSAVREVATVRA
jgi:PAS domain S-box-containing protein